MITTRWMRNVVAVIVFAALTQPCLAGSGGDSPTRSDTDSTRSTERSTTPRSGSDSTSATAGESGTYRFTTTSAGSGRGVGYTNPQMETYVPRVNRLEALRDRRERFPQPDSLHERPIVWVDNSEDAPVPLDADNPRKSGELENLLERDEVLVDEPSPSNKEDGNRIVFCNRKLLEMHLRRDCEMLGDVTPTPVQLKSAREARYAPCTVCYKPR